MLDSYHTWSCPTLQPRSCPSHILLQLPWGRRRWNGLWECIGVSIWLAPAAAALLTPLPLHQYKPEYKLQCVLPGLLQSQHHHVLFLHV